MGVSRAAKNNNMRIGGHAVSLSIANGSGVQATRAHQEPPVTMRVR